MPGMFQISLTSKCNFTCWHCPMAQYRNTGTPEYALTNKRLIPWLEANLEPSGWVLELTGGEPSLYDGIDELVEWLSAHSYRTIIKTNGSNPIQPANGVIRVAAFHQLDNPPKYFDKILIVDKIDREEKERICQENGWDYRVIGYNNERMPGERHGFDKIGYMDPHAHPLPCKRVAVMYTDWPDKYALEFTKLRKTLCCGDCKCAMDCWKFMPDEWKH